MKWLSEVWDTGTAIEQGYVMAWAWIVLIGVLVLL